MRHNGIPVAYRAPFTHNQIWTDQRPEGETVLEIVRSVPDLPREFLKIGIVCINGEVVPRQLWSYVRPKLANEDMPIVVTLHWSLRHPGGGGAGGGGGGGAKQVINIVAALALVVLTAGIGAGLAAPLLGAEFAAGSFGALALAGAVGIAGSLAISALSRPPTSNNSGSISSSISAADDTNTDQKEPASAGGNVLVPGGSVPRVIGTRKVFPPLVCQPLVELVGNDEIVEAIYALNGPHQLNDIRVGGISVDSSDDISIIETREGWESDLPLEGFNRQARTITPNFELSSNKVIPTNQILLVDPGQPTSDVPIWHGMITRNAQDEIWLHINFPGGLSYSATTSAAVPFRLRMRLRGTSLWVNFPEFHCQDTTISQVRRAILLKWKAAEQITTVPPFAPTGSGFTYAINTVPQQATNPATLTQWVSHSYFSSGSGDAMLYAGNEHTTSILNMNLFSNRVEFYLDENVFAKGQYEIQIMRGQAYIPANFTASTYVHSSISAVIDFFNYFDIGSGPQLGTTRANLSDRCILTRCISVWNDPPVQQQGFALIGLKAVNRNLQDVSSLASGYVQDWDGSAWTSWTTTSNPAPHYRDVLSGQQNLDPLPNDIRDDTALVAWRATCTANDWTADFIADDMRTQDALSLLASCGYAQPYQSDQYGITVDDDRTGDAPVQIFTRVNCTNVRFERAFARVPDGFIITYRDNFLDDDQAQTIVYQRDRSIANNSNLLESISYDGLVDVDKVEARALFDLDQANLRATFYYIDSDWESIVCRRGDLVGLQHDILVPNMGDAHIVSKTLGSPATALIGFVLDAELPIVNELNMHAVANMHVVADMHLVGVSTGIAIRHNDGTVTTHLLSNVTGSTAAITLSTPIADTTTITGYNDTNHKYGCMISSGVLGSEYLRMIVAAITPTKDLKATLTLVDEAPTLVRF